MSSVILTLDSYPGSGGLGNIVVDECRNSSDYSGFFISGKVWPKKYMLGIAGLELP